jgi:hypothetical protein
VCLLFYAAGLKCKKFPAEFGQFPALETLMLRFNNFNQDSFENVADVSPALQLLQSSNSSSHTSEQTGLLLLGC